MSKWVLQPLLVVSIVPVYLYLQPVAKYIGGVLVDDLDTKVESTVPPARLNIEAERERLRNEVDVKDKARWRALIREKHRAERKKAKEARKAEHVAIDIRLPDNDEEEDHEVYLGAISFI